MAQQFTSVTLDPKLCRTEIDEFGVLLQSKAELSEKNDIQPFDQFRLDWRADKVSVDSNNVTCVTFDALHRHMDQHLRLNTGF
jgi:hypothetical protein